MSQTIEKDDELWQLVEAYEEARTAAREIRKQTDMLKTMIKAKLGAAGRDGNFATLYRGSKRVRVVETKNVEFSKQDLESKYGEEFVEENKIERFYDTVEVKVMAKDGPRGSQC